MQEHSIVDLLDKYGISYKKDGSELLSVCPFHNDTKPSMKVNPSKNIFKCFACGAGGGYKKFQAMMGDKPEEKLNLKKKVIKDDYIQIIPVPATGGIPDFRHYKLGPPDHSYEYRGVNGELLGFVSRFTTNEGKEVIPLTYGINKGREGWSYKGFQGKRPLYGLQRLKTSHSIIIPEGEKVVDWANKILPEGWCAIGWQGGSNAVNKAKWDIIKDKDVYIWPDKDGAGLDAGIDVWSNLNGTNNVGIVKLPKKAPRKWDLADSNWSPEFLINYIKEKTYYLNDKTKGI